MINRIDGFHQLSGTGFEIAALLRVRVSISKIQAVVFEVICAWIFLQKVIEKERNRGASIKTNSSRLSEKLVACGWRKKILCFAREMKVVSDQMTRLDIEIKPQI